MSAFVSVQPSAGAAVSESESDPYSELVLCLVLSHPSAHTQYLCKMQSKVSKSNCEITSIKV